ncbi:MAG TPA: glycosyltransferase family 61 protein [Rhizomicrobium sp.]|jgi:capsular polysaccharide biosynthesis protein|nr:glycosyltransferase family 61 protein [Rhizomicrobium sp.]
MSKSFQSHQEPDATQRLLPVARRDGQIHEPGQVAVKMRSFRYLTWAVGRGAVKLFPPLRKFMPIYDSVTRYVDAGSAEFVEEDQSLLLSAAEQAHSARARIPIPPAIHRSVALVRLDNVSVMGATGAIIDEERQRLLTRRDGRGRTTYHDFLAEPSTPVDHRSAAYSATRYFSMVGPYRSHRHFYHFLIERLPRIRYLLETFALGRERLVVLTNEKLPAFQKDVYGFIAGRHPNVSFEAVPHRERWRLKQLYVIDDFQPIPSTRVRIDPTFMMPETAAFIRDLVLDGYGIHAKPATRRIYVTRNDTRKRRLINEDALLTALAPYGFEVVAPGTLSFREQAATFADAAIIMGPHGAGLTNMIFAAPGADVVEISPADKVTVAYPMLAKCSGHRYTGLIGTPGDREEHFSIDVAEVLATLQKIEAAPGR